MRLVCALRHSTALYDKSIEQIAIVCYPAQVGWVIVNDVMCDCIVSSIRHWRSW